MDPATPPPQFNISPEPPKKSWFSTHNIFGYLFLLVVAATAVAGIYYWQTVSHLPYGYQAPVHKDPTATWKTYTNAQYGFEFKYPSYMKLQEDLANGQLYVNFEEINLDSISGINIRVLNSNVYETPEKFLSGVPYTTLSISGQQAYQSEPAGNSYFKDTDIFKSPNIYELEYFETTETSPSKTNLALYDQILSTFKFTDSAQVSTTGTLNGHATIGPICPVEQIDNPCAPTPEMYMSYEVIVYKSDAVTVAEQKNLDGQGNYSFNLTPGSYFITITPDGLRKDALHPVNVSADQATTYDFNVDTGIR